ncbi:MAG: alpha-L-fucosidase [Cytophagales bacterium]|nr:alpha-L-fucosidase [Cytophagales bacterium]
MKKTLFLIAMVALAIASAGQDHMAPASTVKIEGDTHEEIIRKAAHVVPTENQYAYKKLEFTCFVHFGPNTFTRMEWGNGKEDPKIFNLRNLDTDQWCRAMKAAGMKLVVFTAKHHDGFVLWQSRYTKHGVMSSPFRDGKGDVLKDLSESCKKYGIKLGVYLSPADLYQIENKDGLYGNLSKYTLRTIPRPVEGRPFKNKTTFRFEVDDYNEYFLNQLFELLTEYGPVHEVWFDGAHPKRKGGQTYNYPAWKELIKALAPEAVIFGREDVRWCGNESGKTRESEWDIIPFEDDPNRKIKFADLHGDLGSREKLYAGNYLHFMPTETNTSIREGWFFRDEKEQKVRNADDVFDIYERSVGGNSVFLLNIPPTRAGVFAAEDVRVLEEVGNRIRETYGTDLLQGAHGPAELLDDDERSFVLGSKGEGEFTVELEHEVETNRFVLQEAIATHSQRIEEHALDVWISEAWEEIATGTTVGYKKILRFPTVTTSKFRIRILKSRLDPSLSKVSAHFYKSRPPQIQIKRDKDGYITLKPQVHQFKWKSHGIDATGNLNSNLEIRYTLDGSKPTRSSSLYKSSFSHKSGEVRAVAFEGDQSGGETSVKFGMLKSGWSIISTSSEQGSNSGSKAIDDDVESYWQSENEEKLPQHISIDLGKEYEITGFAYTPQTIMKEGMIEKGNISVSNDGKKWSVLEVFEFGNLINDPTKRIWSFKSPVTTRYIRVRAERGAGGSQAAAIAELDLFD